MFGAIKAQFINAEDQIYNIEGKEITSHYITIIDEHARSIQQRYTQLKVRDDAWKRLKLDQIITIKSYQGKPCQFDGLWEKGIKRIKQGGQEIGIPQWEFHVSNINLSLDKTGEK